MSKTRKTTPIKFRKATNEKFTISEKPPGKYKYYPLSKKVIQQLLQDIDDEYLFGLKGIELRPMRGLFTGLVGKYRSGEQKIFLYSITNPLYFRKELPAVWINSIEKHGGTLTKPENYYKVEWPTVSYSAVWYLEFVFCHELAHHFFYMNRFRRKRAFGFNEELRTDFYAEKIYKQLLKNWDSVNSQSQVYPAMRGC